MAGQSINDRLTAARYSIAGQGLAKSVCKATTEEVIGPKKKHLDYLLQCTNEPNVSIPQLANLLIERTQNQSWVVVFKALITVHTLMCYGNERFTQYLASNNCKFNLSGFLDKTGTTDQPQLSYDMSTFIRRYAKYINEKALSYRTVAFDFCKAKRGKTEGAVRTMNTDTLLKTLPVLQQQMDALLDFDCSSSELTNGVISAAFMLLFRDLIRLFACYNDGVINLLEKYFDMNKKNCRDALDCYKKFLIRMDRVSEFLKVAEAVGMDKSEIPDLKQAVGIDKGGTNNSFSQAPSSLLDALEGHLASLEGKKISTAASSRIRGSSSQLKSVLSVLNSTSECFGVASSPAASATTNGTPANGSTAPTDSNLSVDEATKQQALAEEEAMYEKLKAEAAKNNPFLSSPAAEAPAASDPILDLFSVDAAAAAATQPQQASTKASDDLLQLAAGNPFADMMGGPPVSNGFSPFPAPAQPLFQAPQTFLNDNAFTAVFGGANLFSPSIAAAESLQQQPQAFDGFGDILKPEGGATSTAPAAASAVHAPTKLISGDLDSSLSSLVDNLNIKGPAGKPQWQSPKTPNKTGGVNWTPPQPTQGNFARPPQQQWAPGAVSAAGGMPGMVTGMPTAPAPQQTQQPAAFDPFGAL